MGLVKPGESTTSGSLRPVGSASVTAFVRVLLRVSAGTPGIRLPRSRSSDSCWVMYGARGPSFRSAGYHRVTLSSLALASRFQGSGREVSLR